MTPEDEAVQVVPYDPAWPERFEEEKALLQYAIGQWATGGIHHVGSTAVPGLAAKPIIDILVGVEELPTSRRLFEPLAELGYQYAPYRDDVMHWFCKPDPRHRTHHLHLVPVDSQRYRDEIAFRDALRARSDLARRYGQLKEQLATEHVNNREAYTRAKHGFIVDALALRRPDPPRTASPARSTESRLVEMADQRTR